MGTSADKRHIANMANAPSARTPLQCDAAVFAFARNRARERMYARERAITQHASALSAPSVSSKPSRNPGIRKLLSPI